MFIFECILHVCHSCQFVFHCLLHVFYYHMFHSSVTSTSIMISCCHKTQNNLSFCYCLTTPFGLWGCKNRPAPFPGRMSVLFLSLDFFYVCVVLLTRNSFLFCVISMLFVCSVACLFLLGCLYQYK